MGEDNNKNKKRVITESLGWLTESSIMPKKHKAIEGVGVSSLFELKAELYKSQEDAKLSSNKHVSCTGIEYSRARSRGGCNDPFLRRNSGVDARANMDKIALKAVTDGSASYAALEKKAELYEKLTRGELPDEEDSEKYCVDFFRKGQQEDGHQGVQANVSSSVQVPEKDSDDCNDFNPFNSKPLGLGRASGAVDMGEHVRIVREVHEEVNQAREKASELKLRRQEQVAARREKLRQAYIRKQLEKAKSSSEARKQDQPKSPRRGP